MCPETESNLKVTILRVVGNLVRDSFDASSSERMMLVWSRAMMKWRSKLDTESQEFSNVCFMCLRKIEADMNSQNSDESFFERSCIKCSHCPVRWHTRCLNVRSFLSSRICHSLMDWLNTNIPNRYERAASRVVLSVLRT